MTLLTTGVAFNFSQPLINQRGKNGNCPLACSPSIKALLSRRSRSPMSGISNCWAEIVADTPTLRRPRRQIYAARTYDSFTETRPHWERGRRSRSKKRKTRKRSVFTGRCHTSQRMFAQDSGSRSCSRAAADVRQWTRDSREPHSPDVCSQLDYSCSTMAVEEEEEDQELGRRGGGKEDEKNADK